MKRYCIACGRNLQERELQPIEEPKPWTGLAISEYPLCDDYGISHLKKVNVTKALSAL